MNDLIMLGTLLPGPKHGYQLKREAGLILGQSALHNNLVYPLLRRLLNSGLVNQRSVPGERGQTRLQYALTAKGRKHLVSGLTAFSSQDAGSQAGFRLRVAMFSILPRNARDRILVLRKEFLQSRLERLAGIQKGFPLDRYSGEVVAQHRSEAQSELKWIARLQRM